MRERSRRRAIPPPATQSFEQRRDVGVARRLRLYQGDARQLVLPLRDQQREVVHASEPVLALGEVQRFPRQRLRLRLRLQRARVVVERAQCIGHLGECLQYGLAILRGRRIVRGDGGAAFRLQLSAVEQWLQQRCTDAPDAGSAQHVAELRG